jgi:hypothetical protein
MITSNSVINVETDANIGRRLQLKTNNTGVSGIYFHGTTVADSRAYILSDLVNTGGVSGLNIGTRSDGTANLARIELRPNDIYFHGTVHGITARWG